MSSGTAGTAKPPATSAALVSLTTGNPVCACGLTRSLSAGTRVRTGFVTFDDRVRLSRIDFDKGVKTKGSSQTFYRAVKSIDVAKMPACVNAMKTFSRETIK